MGTVLEELLLYNLLISRMLLSSGRPTPALLIDNYIKYYYTQLVMASSLGGIYDRIHGRLAATAAPRIVEPADIAEMKSPNGFLTDTGISAIVRKYGAIPSRVNFVDPIWLTSWQRDGCPQYAEFPDFFRASSAAHPLQGLAMPYNLGNGHWTVVYINLEARGAVYFDSLPSHYGAAIVKPLVLKFWKAFHQLFELGHVLKGDPDYFRFEVDTECAKQNDGSSCGIYTVRNCLDLMELKRPSSEVLEPSEIAAFRAKGTIALEEQRLSERATSKQLGSWSFPRVSKFWGKPISLSYL